MVDSENIYDQMNWWSDKNALLDQLPIKFNYFITKIDNPNGLKILDIGCGGGLLAEEFAKQGAIVTGVDASENAIKTAKDHAQQNKLDINYIVGKAEKLPINERYDIVSCTDVFEHVEDLEKCISEISRVLKPNGILLYDTINKTILSRLSVIWINNIILRSQLKKIGVIENNYAVHEWEKLVKPIKLFSLFDKHALNNIDIKGFNFAGFKNGNIQLRIGGTTRIAYIGYAQKTIVI